MTEPITTDRQPPALYMVWEPTITPAAVRATLSINIAAVADEHVLTMRAIVEFDGALTDLQWSAFVERVLPGGLFAARLAASEEVIGTISAIHNPRGSRYYFPGGGQLGYLVVAPAFRGRGVGLRLAVAALDRLRGAGYSTIWLGVEESRLPAIVTYLKAGFVPFLHPPDPDALADRWRAVFRTLGRAADVLSWRQALRNRAPR